MEAKQVDLAVSAEYFSKLLDTLESLAELSYARMFLKDKGFSTSTNWETTRKAILAQEKGKGTKKPVSNPVDKLKYIIKNLMIVGKHYYQVYDLNKEQHKRFITAVNSFEVGSTPYSDAFPLALSENELTATNVPQLTAVEHFKTGVALIYSTPRIRTAVEESVQTFDGKRRIFTYKKEVKQHQFDVVFVPFDSHRIELRISSKVGKRDIESAFKLLENHFFELFKTKFFPLSSYSPIDVHNAIEVLYDKPDYGRVVETQFLSVDNGIKMPRHCRKDISICLREQTYHKAGAEQEEVRCVGVSVRWDNELKKLKLKNRTEVQLESLVHFDYKKCFRFVIENPLGNKKALSIVSDVLVASE
jgi:hypothetical protein